MRAFRGASGETPRGFAAVAEQTGIGLDATLSVDAAGGAFPFWQAQSGGLERRLLRFRSPSTMCRARAPRRLWPRPSWLCAAIAAAGRPRSSS